jgi:hypothetical protein
MEMRNDVIISIWITPFLYLFGGGSQNIIAKDRKNHQAIFELLIGENENSF